MWEVKKSIAWRVGSSKVAMPFSRSWGKTQVCRGTPRDGAEIARGELGDADIVQPGRDRHGLLPVGEAAAIAEIALLLEEAVGDHLIFGGRGDQEFAGGFIGGVVDHGQPLAGEGGPVPAEEGPVAKFVLGDVQAGGGDAVIVDGESGGDRPGGGARARVMARRSAECWKVRAAPRQETPVTVMPLPLLTAGEVERRPG